MTRQQLYALAIEALEGGCCHGCVELLTGLSLETIRVLDNASMHKNQVIRAALPELWAKKIYLYYLPPYSPDLNRIERIFRVVKHQAMPVRTFRTDAALEELPGVGPATAAKIVAYRTQHGGINSVDDLDNVPGIGPAKLAAIRAQLGP